MPQKGKNIYQRKDGRWEGRYIKGRTEAGKAVYGYVYALTYEEAKKKRDEAADGVDPEKLKKNVPKKDSAEAVAIEWLHSLKPQIKKSTFCKYHTLVYSYIIPELGQKDINNISVMDLQNFCNNLFSTTKTRSKPLSSKTVSDTMSVMRRILHYAYIHGCQPACNGREIVIRKTAPDIVVLSASDQRILCKYLFEHKSHRNLGILMCLFTGIRVGDDDDKIRLNQRKPSKYKGLRRFGPEKNLQRINKFMKERPIFYKNLIQMKENIRFYLRCFYCITKVMILQFNSENRTELARNG